MEDSNKKNKSGLVKKASKDFIFSVLALVIYNGVLQLLVYSKIEKSIGRSGFDTVLYLISIISVMGAGFGTAASYSRMMAKKDREETNGDYNVFLLMIAVLSIPVTFGAIYLAEGISLKLFVPVLVLMIVTVFRYYSDVQYRMNIRFKEYFFFFLSVSVGYVLGLMLYPVTKNWVLVMFLGEIFGIIFTVATGKIFRAPFFNLSGAFKENMKSAWYIAMGNVLANLILNSDRILLKHFAESGQVTDFYTASLIGKIVAMLTTPLNGVVISYLTNYKIKMNKKIFATIGSAFLALTFLGALVCSGFSMIYVKLFFTPDVYDGASKFFFLANLGQLLYFISGSLMVVLLAFTEEKLQFIINLIYGIVFVTIVIPVTYKWGMVGFAYGLVAVNIVRFVTVIILGVVKLGKKKETEQ
ncbi:lipopolysaccharide biosynthesis protein [Butyrivibrio sp. M55]|uniref:lipopolysaccharide biosynthesis protein n=1 Tax=Butyrivibrio sp. M55 TaxID=1855323 RepID=UPI0008E316FD|nr:hypothetical protein [Butyrivibrio sp. M55]SFU61052.1 Membrane protein involved in the export of O-antigen and teichoic acid [Butyrivibrio sp. M55]